MATAATSEQTVGAFHTGTQNDVLERRLWMAVLVRAIEDWHLSTGNRNNAERFLFEENKDFSLVCVNAGFDPGRVRSALLRRVRGKVALRVV